MVARVVSGVRTLALASAAGAMSLTGLTSVTGAAGAMSAVSAVAVTSALAGCSDEQGPLPGDEFPAVVAFRAYTASRFDISIDEVEGGPIGEAQAALFEQRVGSIWAFAMWGAQLVDAAALRGWATRDGVVITLEQNLGLLLAEAGVWGGGAPALTARQLASHLTWSMGTSYQLGSAATPGVPEPSLTLSGGAGSLRFAVGQRQPGPGGSGGGPVEWSMVDIALTADHRATATRTPFTPAALAPAALAPAAE